MSFLSAALKGAKLVGAGRDETTQLITEVLDQYAEILEKTLLAKTPDSLYLKRMKSRCAAVRDGGRGFGSN